MDRVFLSPRQAATRIGCGRSSIMRALTSGELPAIRDNKNAWQIDAEALDRWSEKRPGPSPDQGAVTDRTAETDQPEPARTTPADTPETLVRLAAAETRAEMLAEQVNDLKRDRDAWRQQAEKLASESRPVSIWGRLFGR